MGKKIDRFMLSSLLAVGLFFYFEAAFQNRVIAVPLAMFSLMVVLKLLGRIRRWIERSSWHQKKTIRRKSSSVLMHFACMDEQEAFSRISSLLEIGYQNDAPISLALLHPYTQLSRERIFDAWRKHCSSEKLVICTTGQCSPDARVFASSLKSPKLAIVDGDVLAQLACEHSEMCFPEQSEKKKRLLRLSQIAQMLFNRRNAPRGILFSFSMLVMYVFSGNTWYLAASLLLLFIVLVSLRRVSKPAKLF